MNYINNIGYIRGLLLVLLTSGLPAARSAAEYVADVTSPEAIALETFVRGLARGQTINVDTSGPMKSHFEAGKQIYYSRYGQVDLACNLCHDNHDGQYLRGQLLSQGQTNGFPVYRLKTGQITGLHQRMKQCFVKFRAKPFPAGSDELIDLEVFLAARGNGLKIETPAVRY